jgi:hypothetical protein
MYFLACFLAWMYFLGRHFITTAGLSKYGLSRNV